MRLTVIDEQDKKAKKAKKLKKGESGETKSKSPSTGSAAATNGSVSKRHAHAAPKVEEVEDE